MVLKRHIAGREDILTVGAVNGAPIGVIEVGAAADLVLLNDDFEVLGTWVRGKKAVEQLPKQN
jgi:imidazolonepropionase-like amidohydrolase